MISSIIEAIIQIWRNAMANECFAMTVFIIVLIGMIRCSLITFLCVYVCLWHRLGHPWKWIKNKYHISKENRKENSNRRQKKMEKNIGTLPNNNKKSSWLFLPSICINRRKNLIESFNKRIMRNAQPNNQLSKQTIADVQKTAKLTNDTIKWPEIITGLSALSTIIFAMYSVLALLAMENYLEKYNIGYINAHLPSYSFILYSAIAVIVMAIIMLILFLIYTCISERVNPQQIGWWFVSRWFIYIAISLILTAYMVLSIEFLSSNRKINAIDITSVKSTWYYLMNPKIKIMILTISVLVSTLAALMETLYKFIAKKENWIPSFLIIALALMGTTIFVPIEIKDEGDFATVHIQATEDIKAWTTNTLIADDGKQIWAIVYETKTYYFVEPLIDTTDANANGIKGKEKITTQYEIDKNHYMMLDKVGTIVYGAETVKQLKSMERE